MNMRLAPDPNTPLGSVLCTVISCLIVELILTLIHHIHLHWS